MLDEMPRWQIDEWMAYARMSGWLELEKQTGLPVDVARNQIAARFG